MIPKYWQPRVIQKIIQHCVVHTASHVKFLPFFLVHPFAVQYTTETCHFAAVLRRKEEGRAEKKGDFLSAAYSHHITVSQRKSPLPLPPPLFLPAAKHCIQKPHSTPPPPPLAHSTTPFSYLFILVQMCCLIIISKTSSAEEESEKALQKVREEGIHLAKPPPGAFASRAPGKKRISIAESDLEKDVRTELDFWSRGNTESTVNSSFRPALCWQVSLSVGRRYLPVFFFIRGLPSSSPHNSFSRPHLLPTSCSRPLSFPHPAKLHTSSLSLHIPLPVLRTVSLCQPNRLVYRDGQTFANGRSQLAAP